jgi:hypothetical protein
MGSFGSWWLVGTAAGAWRTAGSLSDRRSPRVKSHIGLPAWKRSDASQCVPGHEAGARSDEGPAAAGGATLDPRPRPGTRWDSALRPAGGRPRRPCWPAKPEISSSTTSSWQNPYHCPHEVALAHHALKSSSLIGRQRQTGARDKSTARKGPEGSMTSRRRSGLCISRGITYSPVVRPHRRNG